jgi:chromosomal replication initiation ATPase DnaA
MTKQLVFDLPQRTALGRDAFLVTPSNAEAVAVIDGLSNWTSPVQWLYGPSGCGKSHLASVLANQVAVLAFDASQLTEAALADFLGAPKGSVPDVVLIERLEGLRQDGEEALFHLLNHAKNSSTRLLLLSQIPAAQMTGQLPDLSSRLKAVPAVAMHLPDDALMRGLLAKLFADRQVRIDPRVVDYLLPRIERNFIAMGEIVAHIDQLALSEKRSITVPLVARELDVMALDKNFG